MDSLYSFVDKLNYTELVLLRDKTQRKLSPMIQHGSVYYLNQWFMKDRKDRHVRYYFDGKKCTIVLKCGVDSVSYSETCNTQKESKEAVARHMIYTLIHVGAWDVNTQNARIQVDCCD